MRPTVTIIGRLTADPELRYTNSGKEVASFDIAYSKRIQDPNTGEYSDGDATYVTCTAWERLAKNSAGTLRKGQEVICHGTLENRPYTTKAGEKRRRLELKLYACGPNLRFPIDGATTATPTGSQQQGDPWGGHPTGNQPAADSEPPF